MLRTYTCIICPNGCDIEVKIEEGKILSIEGASCERGEDYVRQEQTNPKRTISSSVLVEGGELPLVSVRLTEPVPKGKIFEVMEEIKKLKVKAPVHSEEVLIKDILGLGSDVIATKEIGENK
jgi:CxxC motif-containing protein